MKLLDYIVCDDIRSETHGKFSLMGTYNDSINIESQSLETIKWPIGLRLGVLLRIALDAEDIQEGETKFRFEISFGEKVVGWSEGGFSTQGREARTLSMPLGPFLVQIDKPDQFTFELRLTLPTGKEITLSSPAVFPLKVRQVNSSPERTQ